MSNQRISTHNAVRDASREMCKSAGLTTRIEDMQTLKQNDIDTKSRVDIICDNFLPGVPMGMDISIADPRQSGLTVKSIPGKAAKKREYSKIQKFKNDLARQGTRFEPFVLESYGRWGYRTRIIFKQLISMIMDNSKLHACALDQSVITHHWRSKITLAMHKQACLGMHNRIHVLQRHHRLKACLKQVTLSEKIIQVKPFVESLTILDDCNAMESYTSLSKSVYTDIQTSVCTDEQQLEQVTLTTINASQGLLVAAESIDSADTVLFLSALPAQRHDSNNSYSIIHVYTDGSCKENKRGNQSGRPAGWGVQVLHECCVPDEVNGEPTVSVSVLAELYGPVVTDASSVFFLGATVHTNNTGELTAVGEGILWLITNLPKICLSMPTPLTHIWVHSDSDYAINTCIGKWTGKFNIPLYSKIRQLINDLQVCIVSLESIANSATDAPSKIPTFSFHKVKAHAGIKGNERADKLANIGQIETCAVGRYLTILENTLPSIQPSTPSSKHIDVKNSPSLHSVSQKLDELDLDNKIPKYETTDNCNFSVTNLDSPPSSHCVIYSPSIPLSSTASSSPWVYPLGIEDYDKM
jgi:ribonuclease HI